jgi:hypothetical protein
VYGVGLTNLKDSGEHVVAEIPPAAEDTLERGSD